MISEFLILNKQCWSEFFDTESEMYLYKTCISVANKFIGVHILLINILRQQVWTTGKCPDIDGMS